EILQAMQVGVWAPTQRISKRNSTGNASWRGPNIEAGGKSAYNNVQVGVGRRNKFCENIISVPLPNLSWIYLYLNPLLLVYESIMKAL
ncbi:hypothetical protein GAY56_02770, partial [Staphylococcus aureus]|nr:hypothetical protein [Staphylococcus aureus]